MVRTVAERAFVPTRHLLEEFGDMMILTGKTIWSALRPPYPYGGELVSQFLFTLRLVWFPLLITTVAINYGAPGLQAGDFLTLFGALDRLRNCGPAARPATYLRPMRASSTPMACRAIASTPAAMRSAQSSPRRGWMRRCSMR